MRKNGGWGASQSRLRLGVVLAGAEIVELRVHSKGAQNIPGAQGMLPGTLDGQRLDARARLLLAELDASQIDLRSAEYAESFVAEQLTQLRFDLGRFQ